jgi:hypothetical protein
MLPKKGLDPSCGIATGFAVGFPNPCSACQNTPHKHPAVGVNLLDLDRKTLYELDFIEKCVCPTADAVAG